MSGRDEGGVGRFEPAGRPFGSPGLFIAARCDECQRDSGANRRRVKVLRGPLRGIVGMVCGDCTDKREGGGANAKKAVPA